MKRLLSLLLLLAMAGMQRSIGQIASFSFGGPDSAPGWTNISGDPARAVQTATAGGVTLSSVAQANWSPNAGGNSAFDYGMTGGAGYFPGAVMANAWIQWNGNSDNLALYNAAIPQIELTGLNPDSTYTLRMSGYNEWYPGMTQYTVAGLTVYGSQQLSTYSNNTQGVTFANVTPDASGMLRVYVNATSGDSWAWISGLQVFSGSAFNIGTPTISLTAPANGTTQSEGGNFIISATASETGGTISRVEFYADTTKIGEADAAPYTMTWVDPDPGTYQVTAKAIDAIGTIATASANVGVSSLNYFWSTTGNIATGGDTSFVGTVDSNRLAFRTRNIERMSILPTGNIGIGTKTPQAALDVVDTVTGVLLPRLTTAQRNGIASGNLVSGLLLYNTDSSAYQYYNGGAWNSVGSVGSGATSRWLFANGTAYDSLDNIAIGTNNPQGYKLAVNGAGIFTKIVAKPQASWPDYVFEKGYNLPSLQELTQYIREHHHLPDVTPEAEIAKNGIDLGAQQATQLKKIEELTLYLIREDQSLSDQNKQLADQNKQLNDQNARLEAQQKEIDELKAMIRANHKQ